MFGTRAPLEVRCAGSEMRACDGLPQGRGRRSSAVCPGLATMAGVCFLGRVGSPYRPKCRVLAASRRSRSEAYAYSF
eukprot:1321110-Alexandrium_andersonii.AAC.1